MDAVRNYLACLVAVSLLTALIQSIFKGNGAGTACSFACGMLVIIVTLSPLAKLEVSDISEIFSRFRLEEFSAATGIEANNRGIAADIIKEQAESYIWDKAANLQFRPESVRVSVHADGDTPYPTEAEITGKYTQQQRIELSLWIEQNLAIAEQKQNWIWK